MLTGTIKSRPRYGRLSADSNASRHVIVAEGEGLAALADFTAHAPPEVLSRATTICAGPSTTIPDVLARLGTVLHDAPVGTRLYACGSEGFIAQVVQLALRYGIDHRSVVTEHRGTAARRVQCVHCKGITEEVTTNVVACTHCGVNLFVRDHFSRRIGAFMGVAADAEVRGELPAITTVFA
jgi:DNA-directed RNA polymerase subunit RPC12/RpoP